MPRPTDQQLNKWWDDLQSVMDSSKMDIDLNSPQDRARIRIARVSDINTHNGEYATPVFSDAKVTISFPFARDEKIGPVEAAKAGDATLGQSSGRPSPDKIAELYEAAENGLLFFSSLPERNQSIRQVVINFRGETEALPDGSHLTKEIITASHTPVKPKKPKKVRIPLSTRFRAMFGDRDAKIAVARMKNTNDTADIAYKRALEDWKKTQKMDPGFVRQCHNMCYAAANYFEVPSEDSLARELAFTRVTTAAHMGSEYTKLKAENDLTLREACECLKGFAETGKTNTGISITEVIARTIYHTEAGEKLEELRKTGALSLKSLAEVSERINIGKASYKMKLFEIMSSPSFKKMTAALEDGDLDPFLKEGDSMKAGKEFVETCRKIIRDGAAEKAQDAPAKDTHVKDEPDEPSLV